MIRNAKRNFEKRLAGNNGGNNRPFYAYIKRKTKSRPGIGPLKNEKKETVTEDQGMAELLNNFFGSVFTREDTENIPGGGGDGGRDPGQHHHHGEGSEGEDPKSEN
jgi:hypothetical protein